MIEQPTTKRELIDILDYLIELADDLLAQIEEMGKILEKSQESC